MSKPMQFDEEFTRKLVRVYSTPDVIAQRDQVLSLANIQPGEQALDIGTGPGMTTRAIGERVGENGSVIGIDVSSNALEIAKQYCSDLSWISFEECNATDLPFDDGTFDVVIATQIYEYVEDIDTAFAELYRIIKPGGRAVILDSDWDSCVWHTNNRERMHRVIDLWNTHCPRPFLPRTLERKLTLAGLNVVERAVHTIFNPDYDQNTYSYGVIDFIMSYLKSVEEISDVEVGEWATELHQLGEKGEYFFSLNRYIFAAKKPM